MITRLIPIFRPRALGWLAAACVVFLAPPSSRGASLLSNPGFESGGSGSQSLPGWTSYGGNAYNESSTSIAHSGSNYFKVYQIFSGATNYTGVYQDYISGVGASYNADGWAYNLSSDKLAGQNVAWIEVSFRDSAANVLALYRSGLITTNITGTATFPFNTWMNLPVTNQYNPATLVRLTNNVTQLVAPAGTYFVRYQVVFQGDASYSGGSIYFDDLNLAQAGGTPYGNWNIVWSDEFNGTTINPKVWTYDTGNGGWGNAELENYTTRSVNSFAQGGFLHLAAQKESYGGSSYTSARLKTQGLFSWLYGRFEWRAQLPSGTGFWPALWLLGTNISSINWPNCGEIDVVENNGAKPTMDQGSLHSGSDETGIYNFFDGDSVTNFHTYTLDWATNGFLFYVDGHLYETQTSWGSSYAGHSYPFPFNQPFFLVLNLAVGGNYLGNPTTNAINASAFPGTMLVDYIRIYNQTSPLTVSLTRTNNALVATWPTNVIGHLQAQFGLPNGLTTNWTDLSVTSSPARLALTNSSAYYRLKSP